VNTKLKTWSTKGWLLGWYCGQLKLFVIKCFIHFSCSEVSKLLSNDKRGLLFLKQFPVSLSSELVWIFSTWNLADTPSFLPIHRYRSLFFLQSKYRKFLQLWVSHNSSIYAISPFFSNLKSFLPCGSRLYRSNIKCLCLGLIPLLQTTNVLYLFFQV